MAWVRLDEAFPDHPKVVTAGPLAAWLHVCALAYCNRFLTDGFIPYAQVGRLVDFTGVFIDEDGGLAVDGDGRGAHQADPYEMAERLVDVGIWEQRRGGFAIHDFLDFQPSRAEVEAQRKVKSDAGKLGGRKSGESRRSRSEAGTEAQPEAETKQGRSRSQPPTEAGGEANGQAKPKPDPDPDPESLDVSPPPRNLGVGAGPGSAAGLALIGTSVRDESATGDVGYRQGDKTQGLVRRLVGVCTGDNRRLVQAEATRVVEHALRYVDGRILDEAIGAYEASAKKPALPRAVIPAIRQRASSVHLPDLPAKALA